jgi:hypothetical protein
LRRLVIRVILLLLVTFARLYALQDNSALSSFPHCLQHVAEYSRLSYGDCHSFAYRHLHLHPNRNSTSFSNIDSSASPLPHYVRTGS